MGKLKTKKGVSKRFRKTKRGAFSYAPSGKSHLNTGKKAKRLRSLRRGRVIKGKTETKYLRRMSPYA